MYSKRATFPLLWVTVLPILSLPMVRPLTERAGVDPAGALITTAVESPAMIAPSTGLTKASSFDMVRMRSSRGGVV